MTTKETIAQAAEELGLSMTAAFVPWSQSRSAGEKHPSLNWRVTLVHNGRRVLTTDYMAGSAHCPSYKQGPQTVDDAEAVRVECESGRAAGSYSKPIIPELADVLYSLASDADVIDHDGFESWASDLGYDPDSRKAEAVYRACLEIALKLRNALGEAGLGKLREAVRDF